VQCTLYMCVCTKTHMDLDVWREREEGNHFFFACKDANLVCVWTMVVSRLVWRLEVRVLGRGDLFYSTFSNGITVHV